MPGSPVHPSPVSPRRARHLRAALGGVAATVLLSGILLGGTGVGDRQATRPAGAAEATSPTPVATRGEMDADVVVLGASRERGSSRSAVDGLDAGWSTQVDLEPGTQMVALSWDGSTSGPDGPASARLALRTRTDGTWSSWTDIAPDPDDQGGEGAGRVGSEVIWLGTAGAEAAEVRVDVGPIHGLELLRMHYTEGEPQAAPATGRSGATRAAQPTIRPRSDWASGGWQSATSGCGSGPTAASSLKHAVIHHTASTNSYTAAQVPGLIDGIYLYHTRSLGWCDIAYNFIVDRFGGIWQGRSGDITAPVVGGHAKGFNTSSVGVSLLGQFEPGASPASAAPTAAMLDSTARLLAWKLGLHGLDPKGTTTVVSGGSTRYPSGVSVTIPIINAHQETSTTACPGANVISQMGALRDLVVAHSGSSTPPNDPDPPPPPDDRWAPFTTVESLVYRQYVDFLRNPGTYEARLWWHQNLTSGATHRNALIVSLLASGELQADSASSVRLYLAYFDRAPDHSGIRYWWGAMDDGAGIRNVSAAFARSPEFTSRYGSLSDTAFVDLVYRNVLGRAPDAEGKAFWTERLSKRKETRGGMMVLFSESGEYRTRVRAETDVVITHEVMLDRAMSTSTMRTWAARVRTDQTALISTLFGSAEYATRVGS